MGDEKEPLSSRNWQRSSSCETNSCIEHYFDGEYHYLRISDEDSVLIATQDEWNHFTGGVRRGEFA